MNQAESGDAQEFRDLQWSAFAVDETPYCMWGEGLRDQNLEFLRSMKPAFFNHVASVHQPTLEDEDAERRQFAAHAIRLNYSHCLETFFALLAAAIQAPTCPLGWLLAYENRELFSFSRKLSERQRLLSRDLPAGMTWEQIVD